MNFTDEIRAIIYSIIMICEKENRIDKVYQDLGYWNNPHFNVVAELGDLLYNLLKEETDTFAESVTCSVLRSSEKPEVKVDQLMAAYLRNHSISEVNTVVQPSPVFQSMKEIEKQVKQNGGYFERRKDG